MHVMGWYIILMHSTKSNSLCWNGRCNLESGLCLWSLDCWVTADHLVTMTCQAFVLTWYSNVENLSIIRLSVNTERSVWTTFIVIISSFVWVLKSVVHSNDLLTYCWLCVQYTDDTVWLYYHDGSQLGAKVSSPSYIVFVSPDGRRVTYQGNDAIPESVRRRMKNDLGVSMSHLGMLREVWRHLRPFPSFSDSYLFCYAVNLLAFLPCDWACASFTWTYHPSSCIDSSSWTTYIILTNDSNNRFI